MEIEENELENLFKIMHEILKYCGLDWNWLLSIGALAIQELAVRKALILLNANYSSNDFQQLAQKLIEELERRGQHAPQILLSIIRSYRHIRSKLLHDPNRAYISKNEAEALLINTRNFVNTIIPDIEHLTTVYRPNQVVMSILAHSDYFA